MAAKASSNQSCTFAWSGGTIWRLSSKFFPLKYFFQLLHYSPKFRVESGLKLFKSCRAQSIQTERKVAHHEGKKGRKTTCQKHTILLRINKFRPDTNLIFVLVLSPIECNIIPRGHQQPRGLKQRMVHPCSPDF